MDRDTWYQRKVFAFHALLGQKGRTMIGLIEPISPVTEVRAAAIIAHACCRYTFPESLQDIAGYFAGSGLISRWAGGKYVTAEMIRKEVVEPACEKYRRRDLPFWCWWDPAKILDCLQRRYLELGLKEYGEAAMRAELWTWDQRDPEIADDLLYGARNPFSRFDPWKLGKPALDQESQETIERIVGLDDFNELLAAFAERHPRELSLREDLSEIAQFFDTLDIVQGVVKSAGEPRATPILQKIRNARMEVAQAAQALTVLEQEMLIRESEATQLFRRFAESHRELIHVDSMGVYSLPERLAAKSLIPDWLHNLVFARGGRMYHSSAGAIPSLIIVFDEFDQIPAPSLGATLLQREGNKAHFSLEFNEVEGSTLETRFSYDLTAADHLYDLILMLVVGWVRIDFCRIAGRELLEHVTPCRVPLPQEWLESVRVNVLPIIRERFKSDPELFREALLGAVTGFEPGAGILACERAKGEQLLADFDQLISGSTDETDSKRRRHDEERKGSCGYTISGHV